VVDGCGSTYPDGYARVFYFKEWIPLALATPQSIEA